MGIKFEAYLPSLAEIALCSDLIQHHEEFPPFHTLKVKDNTKIMILELFLQPT